MNEGRRDTGTRIRPLSVYKAMLEQGEDAFRQVVSFPVLLCRAVGIGEEQSEDTTASFRRPTEVDAHLVLEIRPKDSGEPTTFGRSDSADLVVAESSVSRIHARFHHERGLWKISDEDSRNGSFMGPVRLIPDRSEPLMDRAKLQFGNVHAYFLMPDSFIRYLRQGGEQPPPST